MRDPIDAAGALKDIIEAPSLDAVRQLDARTNIGFAVEPAAGADSEPDVHEDYVSAYDLGRFAESARFVRHYAEQNPVLRGLLPSITTPAQIVAGREDDLVPWSNNEYLADLLPNSEIHPLDAGHFGWEEASDEYGRLIVEWVTGGYQRLGGAVAPPERWSPRSAYPASDRMNDTKPTEGPRKSGALAHSARKDRRASGKSAPPTSAMSSSGRATIATRSSRFSRARSRLLDGAGNEIVRQGRSNFLGELNLLSGQSAFLTAEVTQPLRYIAVDRDALRELLFDDGPLSDLLLATFIFRREALQTGGGARNRDRRAAFVGGDQAAGRVRSQQPAPHDLARPGARR